MSTNPTFQFFNVAIGSADKAVETVRKSLGASAEAPLRVVRALSGRRNRLDPAAGGRGKAGIIGKPLRIPAISGRGHHTGGQGLSLASISETDCVYLTKSFLKYTHPSETQSFSMH
jgi:hypothetical protein